jgi:hypothetical protein
MVGTKIDKPKMILDIEDRIEEIYKEIVSNKQELEGHLDCIRNRQDFVE